MGLFFNFNENVGVIIKSYPFCFCIVQALQALQLESDTTFFPLNWERASNSSKKSDGGTKIFKIVKSLLLENQNEYSVCTLERLCDIFKYAWTSSSCHKQKTINGMNFFIFCFNFKKTSDDPIENKFHS